MRAVLTLLFAAIALVSDQQNARAETIFVDFEASSNGINTGTNWNVMLSPSTPLTDLMTTAGTTTGVSVSTTFNGPIAGSVAPSSLGPGDGQLAQIDDVFVGQSSTFPTITFGGLRPSESYQFAFFGLQVSGDINNDRGQIVNINGSGAFFQDTGDPIGALFINGNDGDPNTGLAASLVSVTSSSLGTLSVAVGNGFPSADVAWAAGAYLEGDFSPAAIPEPSSLSFLAVLGIVAVARDRRRSHAGDSESSDSSSMQQQT